MTDAEALLTKLFAAYNRRDFATFSAGLHDGVDWPDQLRGGRLKGRAALEAYWGVIDQAIQVEVTPIAFALEQDGLSGAVNATAPEPVMNTVFTETLARVLWRPALFPVPAPMLTLVFGEMARATMLASQRAVPRR